MGSVTDWQQIARDKARALLPAPDILSEKDYTAQVVAAALEAAGGQDEATVRMQAERIARHAWEAIRPRLAKRKPV